MKAGVVGAGITGRLLSLALTQANWQVTLYDRSDLANRSSCSMAAAGLLTPISELDKSDLIIFQLGKDALKNYWPEVLRALPTTLYFQQNGCLTLAHPQDQAELTHFINRIQHKLNDDSFYQTYSQQHIKVLEPEISHFNHGYYFPEEGCIDSQQLFHALGETLQHRGVKFINNTAIQKITPGKIYSENACDQFDMVFDCRGLGAKSTYPNLRGVRGELIKVQALDVNIHHPIRLLHPRYSLYLVPRPNNIYLIGASEIESENFGPITIKSALELLSALYYLHPNFAEAQIVETITQCRPALSDHLPQIKYCEGFIAINGLYRHGYLIGPSLVNDVMRWLQNGIGAVQYTQLWEKYNDHHTPQ